MKQHPETRKRALRKAGFVHVAGWVEKDDAPEIQDKIKAAKAKVAEALKNES